MLLLFFNTLPYNPSISMAQIDMPRFFWLSAERQALDEYVAGTSGGLSSNSMFVVERVVASYTISGNYGLALRIIFYFLILVAMKQRRSFPQVRFCPVHMNDTLPVSYSGSGLFGSAWDQIDRNHWKDTVTLFQN